MAAPQTIVSFQAASGTPGELFTTSPVRSQSYVLNSALPSYNVIGATAFTKTTTDGVAAAGNSGNRPFAGILANPKTYASFGTSGGGPLAPTLTLANNTQAELVSFGQMWVTLTNNNANVGDNVYFDNTTGLLTSGAPGVALPSGKSWANAYVDFVSPSNGSNTLAIITINAPVQLAVL